MRQDYSELRCLIPGQKGLTLGSRPMAAARLMLDSLPRSSPSERALEVGAGLDRHLLHISRRDDDEDGLLCLRCRISHPIEARLRALQQQHGERHGLDLITMASFVLDDAGTGELRRGLPFRWSSFSQTPTPPLHPFSAEVLRSYRPELCGLPHWTRQKVQSHPELKTYLKQQGLLLISDWALLAHSSPSRVREALQRCGTLPLEEALALHRAYGTHYNDAKEQHRLQTGRNSDWRPDTRFLAAIAPGDDPCRCLEQLLAIATAVRRYLPLPPFPSMPLRANGPTWMRLARTACRRPSCCCRSSGPWRVAVRRWCSRFWRPIDPAGRRIPAVSRPGVCTAKAWRSATSPSAAATSRAG
ncbi:MAG: hypothetical protein ACKOXO_08715 [Cyanobium sp.]